MGFGRRGCRVLYWVPTAAAGLGRVAVASCLPSVFITGVQSVEVEFRFHTSFEGDINRFQGGLGGSSDVGPLLGSESPPSLEHTRYLSPGLASALAFFVGLRPSLLVGRLSWGFLGGVAPFRGPFMVWNEHGFWLVCRFRFALGQHFVHDPEETPRRVLGSRFPRRLLLCLG